MYCMGNGIPFDAYKWHVFLDYSTLLTTNAFQKSALLVRIWRFALFFFHSTNRELCIADYTMASNSSRTIVTYIEIYYLVLALSLAPVAHHAHKSKATAPATAKPAPTTAPSATMAPAPDPADEEELLAAA